MPILTSEFNREETIDRFFPNAARVAIACLAVATAWPGIAPAEDCALKQLAELPMIDNPMGSPVVSVMIDNQPRQMLIDTGGFWSMLDPSMVGTYPVHRSQIEGRLGPGAIPLNRVVKAPSIQIGPLMFRNIEFFIGPTGYIGRDGTLGENLLRSFDVETDPVDNKVWLISQQHCQGQVVHWLHRDLAEVPVGITARDGRLTIPMVLDGHEIKALIDTGASETALSLRAARRLFDLTPDSPGVEPTGDAPGRDGRRLATYRYRFKSLEMGGIVFNNPWLGLYTTVNAGEPDLILGMHEMRGLHLYFAYGEKKLYATTTHGDLAERQAVDASAPRPRDPLDRINALDLVRTASAEIANRDYDHATADLDNALRLYPDYATAYAIRGGLEMERGDHDRALRDMNEAIRLDPDFAGAVRARARLYLDARQYDKAFDDADRAVALEPKSPEALNDRCWIGAIMGRLDTAFADCNAALAIAPKSAPILDSRALVNFKAGRLDQAIADYSSALSADPKMAVSLYGRGLVKRQKGDRSGDADITAAQGLDPHVAEIFGR